MSIAGVAVVIRDVLERLPDEAELSTGTYMNRNVAIVVPKLKSDESSRREFETRVRLGSIPHPHIVQAEGITSDIPRAVTEPFPQGTLHALLRRRALVGQEINRIAYHVAQGLAELSQRRLIHRALNAQMVLVDDAQGLLAKVLPSFVLLAEMGPDGRFLGKTSVGPLKWQPPETFMRPYAFSEKSDVWGFGVLLWEMCKPGQEPYAGSNAVEACLAVRNGERLPVDDIPADLVAIMTKCWEKDPNDRPTFAELTARFAGRDRSSPGGDDDARADSQESSSSDDDDEAGDYKKDESEVNEVLDEAEPQEKEQAPAFEEQEERRQMQRASSPPVVLPVAAALVRKPTSAPKPAPSAAPPPPPAASPAAPPPPAASSSAPPRPESTMASSGLLSSLVSESTLSQRTPSSSVPPVGGTERKRSVELARTATEDKSSAAGGAADGVAGKRFGPPAGSTPPTRGGKAGAPAARIPTNQPEATPARGAPRGRGPAVTPSPRGGGPPGGAPPGGAPPPALGGRGGMSPPARQSSVGKAAPPVFEPQKPPKPAQKEQEPQKKKEKEGGGILRLFRSKSKSAPSKDVYAQHDDDDGAAGTGSASFTSLPTSSATAVVAPTAFYSSLSDDVPTPAATYQPLPADTPAPPTYSPMPAEGVADVKPQTPAAAHEFSVTIDGAQRTLTANSVSQLTNEMTTLLNKLAAASTQPSGWMPQDLSIELAKEAPNRKRASLAPEEWSVQYSDIKMTDHKLGGGEYGMVFRSTYCFADVAVKVLKTTHMGPAVEEFKNEGDVLRRLKHPHVLESYGMAMDDLGRLLIVTELLPLGSLKDYLSTLQIHIRAAAQEAGGLRLEPQYPFPDFLAFAKGIASGMMYIASSRVVHRDLAARNILIDSNGRDALSVKIADFGMSKRVKEAATGGSTADAVGPLKWEPPESFTKPYLFSEKSDVWSFGVVLWEMLNPGEEPWPEMGPVDACFEVMAGERMKLPRSCPSSLATLINQCWEASSKSRPTFRHICEQLSALAPAPRASAKHAVDPQSVREWLSWNPDAENKSELHHQLAAQANSWAGPNPSTYTALV